MDYYRFDDQLVEDDYYRFDDQIATESGVTDTITPPSSVVYDSTITVAYEGFIDGPPDAGAIGGAAVTVSGTESPVSVVIPDYRMLANGTLVSSLGVVSLTLAKDLVSASANVTLDLPVGSVETIIGTVDTVKANTLYQALLEVEITLTTGMKVWYETGVNNDVFNADSSYKVTEPKYFTLVDLDNIANQYYIESGEIVDPVPDVPNLGADVTGAEPGDVVIRSFESAGINTSIAWPVTGDAKISLLESGPYVDSVNADNDVTMYCRIQASDEFGETKIGGVAGGEFSVTTRDELKPVIPLTAVYSATVGVPFTVSLITVGGDTPYEWDIVGGDDENQYTVNNNGVFSRPVTKFVIESEYIDVTATNDAGPSDVMKITVNYGEGPTNDGGTPTNIIANGFNCTVTYVDV